jgi:hypothetical protein
MRILPSPGDLDRGWPNSTRQRMPDRQSPQVEVEAMDMA